MRPVVRKSRSSLMLLAFACAGAFGVDDFKCLVKQGGVISDEGTFESSRRHHVGQVFTVARGTGRIESPVFVNTMSGQQPVVYDYRPDVNSYTAITIYEPNYTVDFLQINTHVDQALKPFLYKGAWGTIVTGLCIRPLANDRAVGKFQYEVEQIQE